MNSDDELPNEMKLRIKKSLFKVLAPDDELKEKDNDYSIPVAFTVSKNVKAHESVERSHYEIILETFRQRGWQIDEYHFEETGVKGRLHLHGIVRVNNKNEVYNNLYWKQTGYYITRKIIYNEEGWRVYIRKDI